MGILSNMTKRGSRALLKRNAEQRANMFEPHRAKIMSLDPHDSPASRVTVQCQLCEARQYYTYRADRTRRCMKKKDQKPVKKNKDQKKKPAATR